MAERLSAYKDRSDVVVLGLPRGGIPVAFEVARDLGAPLDVFVVRKLGVPDYEELAMGAIATGSIRVLNRDIISSLGIAESTIEEVIAREEHEMQRREKAYRGHNGAPDVHGKTVILIDDGAATGSTMEAAIQALRTLSPARIVVALPTASASALTRIHPNADEVISIVTPTDFFAVGQFYADFSQTSDDEVKRLLAKAKSTGSDQQKQ